ncbi:MAG: hypothetical protein JRH20_03510 [Deltaproteobacteria bacterium]|nr:hypothetical protein [Deltaproteobacteria bacterium]
MRTCTLLSCSALVWLVITGCSETASLTDAGLRDAGSRDAGLRDAGSPDAAMDARSLIDGAERDTALFDVAVACILTEETRTETESGLRVVHHHGQSFVSWRDRAEGMEGETYRYQLYRSVDAITDEADLAGAELVVSGILNHSGQLFGEAFRPLERLNPESAMAMVEEGEPALELWSGLWVTTTRETGCAYYAVIATDVEGKALEAVSPGVNATVDPVSEGVALRAPIQRYNSDERGVYSPQTRVTGTPSLPLIVNLHASSATGGGAGDYGDYYNYFGDTSMGYQDGIPSVFSVEETHSGPQLLTMKSRDTIVSPDGSRGVETHWFGYVADPSSGQGRYAYPYTEARLLWTIPWVIAHYSVDLDRVYGEGGSMGAWGTMTFSFRHPEIFAAVYPNRPRFYQRSLASLDGPIDGVTLPNGTSWEVQHDSVAFVRVHPADLPFLGWNIGRKDGYATWKEQLDMVHALHDGHHGFAFAWNNNDHSGGVSAGEEIVRWYPREKFARNLSYPAFANSSIDDDLGSGDPSDGDLEGGINLGFDWTLHVDSSTEWRLDLRNGLAAAGMQVDVTPRRLQAFKITPGETLSYEVTRGGLTLSSGKTTANEHGLITLEVVSILPGTDTSIQITH